VSRLVAVNTELLGNIENPLLKKPSEFVFGNPAWMCYSVYSNWTAVHARASPVGPLGPTKASMLLNTSWCLIPFVLLEGKSHILEQPEVHPCTFPHCTESFGTAWERNQHISYKHYTEACPKCGDKQRKKYLPVHLTTCRKKDSTFVGKFVCVTHVIYR